MQASKNGRQFSLVNGQAYVVDETRDDIEIVGRRTGKVHHLTMRATWRSVWIREKGNWRLWRSQQLSKSSIADGKPFRLPSDKAATKAPVVKSGAH